MNVEQFETSVQRGYIRSGTELTVRIPGRYLGNNSVLVVKDMILEQIYRDRNRSFRLVGTSTQRREPVVCYFDNIEAIDGMSLDRFIQAFAIHGRKRGRKPRQAA